jgi:hypothetical protein
MIVLFFRGDLSFSLEDSLSCRIATSATGSELFNTNNSARGKAALSSLAKMENSVGTSRGEAMVYKQRLVNIFHKGPDSK